ncbi:hypothetical protein [Flavobacterium sp.]|uniref:hypothetical protein n=1 Tax=Flavobacterium sp. TaxID=239 RepID=UPI0037BEC2E4
MSDMNLNERGRITGMPGTTTTVMLHPRRLGARMRNNIIRQLENRVITGGWQSKSAQLAKALAAKYGLQVSNNHWNGMRILGITEGAGPLVAEIVRADYTAWILENPGNGASPYYKDRVTQSIADANELNPDFFVSLHYDESVRKVTEILAEHTSQELKDKAKHVANMLRGTEPIEITTFQE